MPLETPDTTWQIIIAVALFIILPFLIYALVTFSQDFSRELRLLKCEINRTDGAERKHWQRKKRRLWLSLIPFIKYK